MPDDIPVAELARKLRQGDHDARVQLTAYFFDIARKIALKKLSKDYPRPVYNEADEIGLQALSSLLSYVGRMDHDIADKNEFLRLFMGVLRRKIADTCRKYSKQEPIGDFDPPAHELTALDMIIEKETLKELTDSANRLVDLIHKQDDSVDVMIGDLGIIQSYSAPKIREALLSAFPKNRVPKLRATQIRLNRIWEQIFLEYGV